MAEIREGLVEILKRGGVYSGVDGTTPREVLAALIKELPPMAIQTDKLLEAVLEREEIMSTGIGDGIALPHPRSPLITSSDDQFAAIAFLKTPADWNSLDGKQVDTLFLIISASSKQHLQTMSEIAFFCRQKDFFRLLKDRAPLEKLLDFIEDIEKKWN